MTDTYIEQVNFSALYSYTEYAGDYVYFERRQKVFDDLPTQTSLSLSKIGVYLLAINPADGIEEVFTSSFSARFSIDDQIDQVISSPENSAHILPR